MAISSSEGRAAGSGAGSGAVAGSGAGSGDVVTDVAIIGAGPAGMSAAAAAADAGVTVTLIDAEPVVGGQFWRHPAPGGGAADPVPDADSGAASDAGSGAVSDAGSGAASDAVSDAVSDGEVARLHHDLRHYQRLRRRLAGHAAAGTLTRLARHEVWAVSQVSAGQDSDGAGTGGPSRARFVIEAVTGSGAGRHGVTIRSRTVLLATGAYDLQLPFPGWDLPGVMTAGGVQSLLKGHAVLAGRRVVVAGTGPFLLSVASGLVRSGAEVRGVFEAARPAGWLREPGGVIAAGSKLWEGAGYARDLLRHKVGYHTGWTVLSAGGGDRLDSVTVAPLDRVGRPVAARSRVLAADVLAVGWGFAAHLDLPLALGCATTSDTRSATAGDVGSADLPVVLVDADQRTTVPGVYAAGEICGVGGAALAAIEGEIAGTAAAQECGGSAADPRGRGALERRRAALRTFAGAMSRTYPVPRHWIDRVRDDTLVCRCEEVTAGAIREVARHDGVADARSAKLLARPGMGWCQGRICGYATECLAAAAAGTAPSHRPTERAIATPLPLGIVAAQAGS